MSVNLVILMGNLTRDAEARTVGQNNVISFGIATGESFTNRNGEQVTNTEFHDVEFWGTSGVFPYLKKGQMVYVQGSIKTDQWTDQNGQERKKTKIRAYQVQLAGNKGDAPAQNAPAPQGYRQPQQPAPAPQAPRGYQPQAAPQGYAPAPQGYAPAPQGYQQPAPQPAYPPQGTAVPGAPYQAAQPEAGHDDLPF